MRKSFTMLEILVAVVIISILASLGMVGYTQILDNTRQKVCAVNQKIIVEAIRDYFLDTGVAPEDLADLRPQDLYRHYVEAKRNADWWTRFSYFFVKLNSSREAYGEIDELVDLVDSQEMGGYYGIRLEVFQCPADNTPPPGGVSYGICTDLREFEEWSDVPDDLVILGDCASASFDTENELDGRHYRNLATQNIALGLTKTTEVQEIEIE